MQQLGVLQKTLRNLKDGTAKVERDVLTMLQGGGVKKYSKAEVAALLTAYVWFDFFGVPQLPKNTSADVQDHRAAAMKADPQLGRNMAAAVSSLPAYVQLSRFFIILAPPVDHVDFAGVRLTHASWKRRGWCRVERAARALSAGDTRMLLIASEGVAIVSGPFDFLFDYPGTGEFSFEGDREGVSGLMRGMLTAKLDSNLRARRFGDYRFLFALRGAMFEGHASDRGSLRLVDPVEAEPQVQDGEWRYHCSRIAGATLK